VEEAAKEVTKVYGYFNNHFHGYALENCLYLIEKAWFIFRCTRASQRKDYEQAVKSWFLF